MIDSHCHLDLGAFDRDRGEVVARAEAAGVEGMLVPAVRPRTWAALATWAREHATVRIAIGVHPQVVPELDEEPDADEIARAATEYGAVAIGECGLDGPTGDPETQERIFRAHIRASRATRLPLIIHILRAHDHALRILREEGATAGVLHSYSGGAALVPVYARLGLCFSFAGPVTYANARRPVEAARAVPAELLLAETDAPDQAPRAHRGGRSEPAFLRAVIEGLAAARHADPDDIAALTAANARALFASWC